MDTNRVLDLVRQIQAADSSSRESSQTEIDNISTNDPGALALAFVTICGESSVEVNTRQMAAVLLRFAVLRHWSIGFSDYTGPAINGDTKEIIRKALMQLIGCAERKVRSSSAQILSKIATVEFPEEWPTLIEDVLQMIQNSSSANDELVQGALAVMNEILFEALSAEEFLQVGPALLPALYQVASDSSYTIRSRTSAIECFKRSMLFFDQMEHPTVADNAIRMVHETVPKWFELFTQLLTQKISHPGQFAAIKLKMEIITTVKEIEVGLERVVTDNLMPVFSGVWTDLAQLSDLYSEHFVKTDNGESVSAVAEEDADIRDATLDRLVTSEFSLFEHCLEQSKTIQTQFENDSSLLQQFAVIVVLYAQLPKSLRGDDDDDEQINQFVTDENDMCMEDRVRFDVANVACLIENSRFVESLWGQIEKQSDNWIVLESCLFLMYRVLGEGKRRILAQFSPQVIDLITDCINSCIAVKEPNQLQRPGLLQARALLLAGTLCKELDGKVKDSTKQQFLEQTLTIGSQSTFGVVRAAALFTMKKYSDIMPQKLQSHQETLFQNISSLVPVAEDDTPAFLVEVLQHAVRLNYDTVTRSSDVIQLLFTLASKDTANVELTTETSDVFEDIVDYATNNGLYAQVCQNALPTLMNGVAQMKDWEYNSDSMLAIGLIGELIDKGPIPLPQEILELVLDPLYEIIINANDTEILQAASEAFNYLVEHASEQLKRKDNGPDMVLKVTSKLLDPSLNDSATINSGTLISTIIKEFGSDLGQVFRQLLEAVAIRLSTAENLVLVQNLVSVFSDLVLQSAKEVVDILWDIQIQDQRALQMVLTKWLGSFDVLRGYEEIRKNVIALQHLFDLDDDRIKAVIVDGDLENPEPGVILTRSKAKTLTYQKISAHVKIIKLLVKELSTTPYDDESNKGASSNWYSENGTGDDNDEDEDGWEDVSGGGEGQFVDPLEEIVAAANVDDEGYSKRQVDSETHNLIVSWFKKVAQSNTSSIREIYDRDLTSEERKILVEHGG